MWKKAFAWVMLLILAVAGLGSCDMYGRPRDLPFEEYETEEDEIARQADEEAIQLRWEDITSRWNDYSEAGVTYSVSVSPMTVDEMKEQHENLLFGDHYATLTLENANRLNVIYYGEEISIRECEALVAAFAGDDCTGKVVDRYRTMMDTYGALDTIEFDVVFSEDASEANSVYVIRMTNEYLENLETVIENSNMVSDSDYIEIAKELVDERLTAPLSAVYGECAVEEVDEYGRRLISGELDSQNAFGTMVRGRYIVIILSADIYGNYTYYPEVAVQLYDNVGEKAEVVEQAKYLNEWGEALQIDD